MRRSLEPMVTERKIFLFPGVRLMIFPPPSASAKAPPRRLFAEPPQARLVTFRRGGY